MAKLLTFTLLCRFDFFGVFVLVFIALSTTASMLTFSFTSLTIYHDAVTVPCWSFSLLHPAKCS